MSTLHPIIIVTGANSGIGFGICHRLLVQLSQRNPSDALPQPGWPVEETNDLDFDGLTLIMACRDLKPAEMAKAKLIKLLDEHIDQLKRKPGYDGHADVFRRNLQIDIHYIDLASTEIMFKFADIITEKYPYVSHIVCNAGVASLAGMNYYELLKQLSQNPVKCFSEPTFMLQNPGERSVDGLGWVWQCNVFGHYVLYRSLQPKLIASPLPPRVIWTSSMVASPKSTDQDDWQLLRTAKPYEASKYQIDLLGTVLDRQLRPDIRHFVAEPGAAYTNIAKTMSHGWWILEVITLFIFYLFRILGSTVHTIKPYTAANSATRLCLVPLSDSSLDTPVKYHSRAGNWGDERIVIGQIKGWDEDKALKLLERFEQLFRELQEAAVEFEVGAFKGMPN